MNTKVFIILFSNLFIYIHLDKILKEEKNIIMNIYYLNDTQTFETNISNTRDENAVASAIYNKTYEDIGWDYLSISTYEKNDNKYSDSIKSYAMGYLEGVLTKDRIIHFYNNIIHHEDSAFDTNFKLTKLLKEWFEENLKYMEDNIKQYMSSSKYWEEVHYIYQQLKGLHEGYNSVVEDNQKIDFITFQIMPALYDQPDIIIQNITNKQKINKKTENELRTFIQLNSHCSALVKLSNDLSDIWFGHNTWASFIYMMRIMKEYHFISKNNIEKSKINIFPSYPGALSSLDDFYYLDSKLLVFETTNSALNFSVYKDLSPKSLFYWVRVIVANRLASSAEEWTNIFKQENSGTYNNQFVILDLNKIDLKKRSELPDKTLMIIEQIPGYTETNDVTYILNRDKYYGSYNVPYSENIRNKSFVTAETNNSNSSEILSYWECPRAQIIKRDQGKINSNEDFKNFLRYNDFKNDELSDGLNLATISPRNDLQGLFCSGAIDAKFISVKEILEGKNIIHIISGPTNDNQPTFSWNNTSCLDNDSVHDGVVDTWHFPWVDYKIQLIKNNSEEKKRKKKKYLLYSFIIGGGVIILLLIIVLIVVFIKTKKSYDNLKSKINKISFIGEGNINGNDEQEEPDLLY